MTPARRWLVPVVYLLLAGTPRLGFAGPPDPATGAADEFFGLTNLHTFHLTIAAEQWTIMERVEPSREGAAGGPVENGVRPPRGPEREGPGGFGGPPRGFRGPGGGPGGGPPLTGADFQEGRATLEFNGRDCGTVAVRFKGNSSFRWAQHSLKRSLKLDFNDHERGRTFFGLTKLNLNNNAMDPSQLREALAYEIFRQGGVPAGRTAFALVFLTVPGRHDRACAGLYTTVIFGSIPGRAASCGSRGT